MSVPSLLGTIPYSTTPKWQISIYQDAEVQLGEDVVEDLVWEGVEGAKADFWWRGYKYMFAGMGRKVVI